MAKIKCNPRCIILLVLGAAAVALALWYYFAKKKKVAKKEGFRDSPSSNSSNAAQNAYDLFKNDSRPNELKDISPTNLEALIQDRRRPLEMHDVKDFLPVPNPSTLLFNRDVRDPAVFIDNRNVTVRTRSRTSGSGNPVLGDVPIVPQKHGWFDPVQNETDLRTTSIGAAIQPRQMRFRQNGDMLEVDSV